jgi:hypothetical protein
MLVNIIAATAFMLLPYNLDYLTLLVVIAMWLAWKVEGGGNSKGPRPGRLATDDLGPPNRFSRRCDSEIGK